MKSNRNEIGKNVLEDLRATIRTFRNPKKDIAVKFEGIEETILLCEKYFAAIYEYLEKETLSVSKKQSNRILAALQKNFDGFKDPKLVKSHRNRKINKATKPSFVFEDRLICFPSKYIVSVLPKIQNEETVAILPYLLASYYLNGSDILNSGSVYRIFEETSNRGERCLENINRDISSFAKQFMLDKYLHKQIKKKSGKVLAEAKIKNLEDYDEHIRSFFYSKRYPYKSALLLTDLQLRCVFDVFVYSLCALACANSTRVSELIDYERSYELFDKHTRAFHVSCFPPSWLEFENDEMKTGHASMCTGPLYNLALGIDAEKFKAEVDNQPSSCHRYLQKCGIDISWLTCDAEKYSNEWYKQTSLLFAYYLHPMNYLGWKKNSEQFPAMEPKHDDR